MTTAAERVIEFVDEVKAGNRGTLRGTIFTVEPGAGETYSSGKPTLYAHSTYGRGSVLSGRPRRTWVMEFESEEEAREAIKAAKIGRKTDWIGGSTHVPHNVATAGLEDENGHPSYGNLDW